MSYTEKYKTVHADKTCFASTFAVLDHEGKLLATFSDGHMAWVCASGIKGATAHSALALTTVVLVPSNAKTRLDEVRKAYEQKTAEIDAITKTL
jgi:hypothetical protein